MKTADDYASELGTRTSTFAECRDLFAQAMADARRAATMDALDVLDSYLTALQEAGYPVEADAVREAHRRVRPLLDSARTT